MSTTYLVFIFGYMGGMACGLFIATFNLCRLRLHPWGQWSIAKNGGGQTRRCKKCQLTDARPFRDFTITPAIPAEERPEL